MIGSSKRIHYEIHVYDNGRPPAEPTSTTLCKAGRSTSDPVTQERVLVNCITCRQIMRRLGL